MGIHWNFMVTMTTSDKILRFLKKTSEDYQIFKAREVIFEEVEPFKGLFYIVEGKVKIVKKRGDKSILIRLAVPHDLLAITSYLDGKNSYDFTAIAIEPYCKVVHVSANEFHHIMETSLDFHKEIIKILCHRVKHFEKTSNTFRRHLEKG